MRETPDFFERQSRLRELLVSKEKPFGWTVRINYDFVNQYLLEMFAVYID